MNYITHLNNFFTHIKTDPRLTPSHVSLYMSLFQHWNHHRFQNPFPIYRHDIMQQSKIGSKNTYHKCIKELHQARYITYHPAISKYQPVKIAITNLEKQKETPHQLTLFNHQKPPPTSPKIDTHNNPNIGTPHVPILTPTSPISGTHTVPKMGHLIKHTNNINSECKHTHEKIFIKNKKIQCQINTLATTPKMGHDQIQPPSITEVKNFFHQNAYPTEEAQKFYYYNQAKNWLLQKNIPITDWQAVAHKWMLNTTTTSTKNNNKTNDTKNETTFNTINPENNPDYSEPL